MGLDGASRPLTLIASFRFLGTLLPGTPCALVGQAIGDFLLIQSGLQAGILGAKSRFFSCSGDRLYCVRNSLSTPNVVFLNKNAKLWRCTN
jgi:hypothetical protein